MSPRTATTARYEEHSPDDGGHYVPVLRWVFPLGLDMVTVLRGEVSFGRDEHHQVALPGARTSRRHATISTEPTLTIRDLGSANGTFVNGQRVTQSALAIGDVLRIGDCVALVQSMDVNSVPPPFGLHEIVPGYFVGSSLLSGFESLARAARSQLPVVVEGETGSGKEGVAVAVHHFSQRPGPFVALNCAALPESMAEAELFGYRKGAFTGAHQASLGHLRAAHRGTLFLDEVIELPKSVQAKLLRALEQNEVTPLGEAAPVRIDVGFVVAAQSPLQDAVTAGTFRGDLYARLDGYTFSLPPLRNRLEYVPLLFAKLIDRAAGSSAIPGLDGTLVEALCLHSWLYNVRELDRLARQLMALHGEKPLLSRSHLPPRYVHGASSDEPSRNSAPPSSGKSRDEAALAALLDALRATQGNVRQAALVLGISRQKVYRMMDSLDATTLASLRERGDKG